MAPNFSLQNIDLQSLQKYSTPEYLLQFAQQQMGGVSLGGGLTMNSIFGALGDVEGMVNGNSQQQGQNFYNLLKRTINTVFSVISSNEASEATKKASENSKKASDANSKAQSVESKLTKEIDDAKTFIDNEKGVIDSAQKEIETAQKKLDDAKEEIQKIIEQIEQAKKDANSAESLKEQQDAINRIPGLLASLSNYVSEIIPNIQNNVKASSDEVKASVDAIEAKNAGVFELQTESTKELSNITSEVSQTAQSNAQEGAIAPQNKATAVKLRAEAAELSSGPQGLITGTTLAPKLYAAANDQDSAATVRKTTSSQTLATLQQGIGKLTNCSNLMGQFESVLGNSFSEYVNSIGSWNDKIDPLIKSFGSFEQTSQDFQTSNQEYTSAIQEDNAKIEAAKVSVVVKPEVFMENSQLNENNYGQECANYLLRQQTVTESQPQQQTPTGATSQPQNSSDNNEQTKKQPKIEGLKTPDLKKLSFGI